MYSKHRYTSCCNLNVFNMQIGGEEVGCTRGLKLIFLHNHKSYPKKSVFLQVKKEGTFVALMRKEMFLSTSFCR